jgi:hypothetical protein
MKGIFFVLAFAFVMGALVLPGCVAPQPSFSNCCMYANASEDGRCITADRTEYEIAGEGCDLLNMACNVTLGEGDEAHDELLPICPKSELLKCNSSCVGMFCGSFEFDPRPPISLDAEDMNDSRDTGDADTGQFGGTDRGGAKGLYNGECKFLNMSPATLRATANTNGGFALNSFRFGVGDSFADFDEASMYYPLTDFACKINLLGTTDRYANYAIPNVLVSGKICSPPSPGDNKWMCIPSTSPGEEPIWAYSYFDCATKCLLQWQGDYAGIDPDSAYLTERNGQALGNPFAYGAAAASPWGPLINDKDYKSAVVESSFYDGYPLGYNYYGADFERDDRQLGPDRGGIDGLLAEQGSGEFIVQGDVMDYYAGAEADLPVMEWDSLLENFVTVEREPHRMYNFLLTYHSVYSRQFQDGHYLADGSWANGAEFECTLENNGCLSGYCNIFDYSRGVCQNMDDLAKDANCDCMYDFNEGGVVCTGKKLLNSASWDRYGDATSNIEVATTLAAPIDRIGDSPFTHTSMPSKGRIVKFNLDNPDYISGIAEADRNDIERPFLVIFLGGEDTVPQYTVRTGEGGTSYGDMAGEDVRWDTLTIPQVLSREKWDGCGGDCGKFYTTFVDQCVPTYEENPGFYADSFSVCYAGDNPRTGWRGMYLDTDGTIKDENWNCQGLELFNRQHVDGKGDGRSWQVYCYARDEDGNCEAYSVSALVIRGKDVIYTDADGNEAEGQAFGKCLLDGNGNLLTKTYGYCEQCGYLTMAKDSVVALPEEKDDPGYEALRGSGGSAQRKDNKYCPSLMISTIYSPAASSSIESAPPPLVEWEGEGVHPSSDDEDDSYYRSQCTMPDGSEVGMEEAWPDYLPNAYYLKSKLQDYLQRNIMPVLFADDDGLYRARTSDSEPYKDKPVLQIGFTDHYEEIQAATTTHPLLAEMWSRNPSTSYFDKYAQAGDQPYAYSTQGTYLADSVMDLGAGIIVVKNLSADFVEGSGITTGLGWRSGSVRAMCPNCMVAVAAGYDEGKGSHEEKMRLVSRLFGYGMRYGSGEPLWEDYSYNMSCANGEVPCLYERLDYADVIAVDWTLGGRNSHCDIEGQDERFAAILADEMEFGSKMLSRFGKPLVVTDLTIIRREGAIYDEGVRDCWDEESAARFVGYLGQHTEDLIRSGHIGIIYGDWSYGHSSGTSGPTYIRTQESIAGGSVGGYRGPLYEGTLFAARDFSGYGRMISLIEVPVKESCACVPCTSTDPAEICNGQYAGSGALCEWEGARVMVKWPDDCITGDACMPEGEIAGYFMDCTIVAGGQETSFSADGADVAANPELYKQMIASISNTVERPCFMGKTYGKTEITRFLSHPVLFRTDGNLSYTCNPLSAAEGALCGPTPSLDLGQMDCTLRPKMGGIVPGGGIPFPDLPSGPIGG